MYLNTYFLFVHHQSHLGLELEAVLQALRDLLEWVRIKEEQLASQQPMTEQTEYLTNQVSLQKVRPYGYTFLFHFGLHFMRAGHRLWWYRAYNFLGTVYISGKCKANCDDKD